MNKCLIISGAVLLTMPMTAIASATKSTQVTWSGVYAGMNAGFLFNNSQLRSQQIGFTNPLERCDLNSESSSFFPGIQLGYLRQYTNDFVSGLETNLTFNTRQYDALTCQSPYNSTVSDRFNFRSKMQGSIKMRGGRALHSDKGILLPFLTAGLSFAGQALSYQNEGGDYYSKNTTRRGWLVGAGLEWSFNTKGSIRAEYYFIDYGNTIRLNIPEVYGLLDTFGGARVRLRANNIALAVNYWI